jgi:GDPmannose 4,6-dehydratase
MTRTAFVTGVTGQDGAYLAAFLLAKGYKVFGGYRRVSSQTFWRLRELKVFDHTRFRPVEHDLTDLGSNIRALTEAQPDEVYNLAGQSFVGVSFREPDLTASISAVGALRLLESVLLFNRDIRLYQASSAEMFGKVQAVPQSEATPFYPRSPYGVSKAFAHWMMVNYREAYGMFACGGILFNHESPFRGPEFVTRKISQSVSRIAAGRQNVLSVGNLDASRDWGFAGDFVKGMWQMLQLDAPSDYVLATGITTTVRRLVEMAFQAADLPVEWQGVGIDEVGRLVSDGKVVVRVDPALYRPAEVDLLIGDASKARDQLGWRPKVNIESLCKMMVAADMRREGIADQAP